LARLKTLIERISTSMNLLKLVQTGDVRPTCGTDNIHTPIEYEICGCKVRAIIRPNQILERRPAFVLTDVAKALGYARAHEAGSGMNLVDGEDKGSDLIRTLGGPQNLRVLTWKGLTKFLARSNHERAQQFLDVLAQKSSDLAFYGIAFADASATEGMARMDAAVQETLNVIAAELKSLKEFCFGLAIDQQKLTELVQANSALAIPGAVYRSSGYVPRTQLPVLDETAKRNMRARGYVTAASFLTREIGQPPAFGRAASLARRTANYCDQSSVPVFRFLRSPKAKSGPVLYLHQDSLKLVHRCKWSAKAAEIAEAQMNFPLFNEAS
jgi:hypothetical protein